MLRACSYVCDEMLPRRDGASHLRSGHVRVREDRIVAATLAHDDYLPLIAPAAARDHIVLARPEGSERVPPTIVIEGVEELVEALRAA